MPARGPGRPSRDRGQMTPARPRSRRPSTPTPASRCRRTTTSGSAALAARQPPRSLVRKSRRKALPDPPAAQGKPGYSIHKGRSSVLDGCTSRSKAAVVPSLFRAVGGRSIPTFGAPTSVLQVGRLGWLQSAARTSPLRVTPRAVARVRSVRHGGVCAAPRSCRERSGSYAVPLGRCPRGPRRRASRGFGAPPSKRASASASSSSRVNGSSSSGA